MAWRGGGRAWPHAALVFAARRSVANAEWHSLARHGTMRRGLAQHGAARHMTAQLAAAFGAVARRA
eukprot:9045819-Alexandrium_andersonii.AAC.1